jgi:hypothetical protein
VSALHQALAGYLAVRRACGYHLDRPEKLLGQFLSYLDDAQADTVTTSTPWPGRRCPAGTRAGMPTG